MKKNLVKALFGMNSIFYVIISSIFILAMSNNYKNNSKTKSKHDTSHLTQLQKHITQEGSTEQAFNNEYWDNKKEGIYVDVVTGKPLFSSKDKYDSGSGWPSFTKPIDDSVITENIDYSLGMKRVEIKSSDSNSHVGHVFPDGPKKYGGNRYCTNSASLKFIPKTSLKQEGYGEYLKLFDGGRKLDNNDKVVQSIQYQKAVLAGGCFWGMEAIFSELDGVIDVVSGYTGGSTKNPSYQLITTGITGHAEAIEVTFDPQVISYENILKFFFKIHDPTTLNKQQHDIGTQYRSAIFYLNDEQKNLAQSVINAGNSSGVFKNPIVTTISRLDNFFKAEEYHQNYIEKNPNGYTCHIVREDWSF